MGLTGFEFFSFTAVRTHIVLFLPSLSARSAERLLAIRALFRLENYLVADKAFEYLENGGHIDYSLFTDTARVVGVIVEHCKAATIYEVELMKERLGLILRVRKPHNILTNLVRASRLKIFHIIISGR